MEKHLNFLKPAIENDGAKFKREIIPAPVQVEPRRIHSSSQLGYAVNEKWLQGICRTELAIRNWAKDHRVDYLDLTSSFRSAEPPVFYEWDPHMNERGHELTARVLSEWLQDGWKN